MDAFYGMRRQRFGCPYKSVKLMRCVRELRLVDINYLH